MSRLSHYQPGKPESIRDVYNLRLVLVSQSLNNSTKPIDRIRIDFQDSIYPICPYVARIVRAAGDLIVN